VSKFFLLIFLCLFCFSNLFAQSDTTPPVPTAAQKQTDSIPVKKDTVPVRIRHSPKVSTSATAASSDTVKASAHDTGKLRTDTGRTDTGKRDTMTPKMIREPIVKVFTDFLPWRHILSTHPSFNFTGRPVVEEIEIHRSNSRDSLFYLLVGILFYFALFRMFFEKYFSNLLTLFFRVSIRQQQIREQVLQAPQPSLLLNVFFVITGGLYACFLLRHYRYGEGINFWILYLNCMIALIVIYLVKFLVLKFCGWVFNISRATDTYIFVVFLVNKMLGIFLLPFLILITFSEQQAQEIYITISLVMVFIFMSYRILASFRPIANEIKLTPFHYFLYLCAFEIAPLLLIYKVLLAYLEKGY